MAVELYRKFSIKGAGRGGKDLGVPLLDSGSCKASRGFLQNENRTIFGRDMHGQERKVKSLTTPQLREGDHEVTEKM